MAGGASDWDSSVRGRRGSACKQRERERERTGSNKR
jgi:hypothetical protein